MRDSNNKEGPMQNAFEPAQTGNIKKKSMIISLQMPHHIYIARTDAAKHKIKTIKVLKQ